MESGRKFIQHLRLSCRKNSHVVICGTKPGQIDQPDVIRTPRQSKRQRGGPLCPSQDPVDGRFRKLKLQPDSTTSSVNRHIVRNLIPNPTLGLDRDGRSVVTHRRTFQGVHYPRHRDNNTEAKTGS